MNMNNYGNPIEEYEYKAIKAWQAADKLQKALDSASSLVYWNMKGEGFDSGYEEGYNHLVEEIEETIKGLRQVY